MGVKSWFAGLQSSAASRVASGARVSDGQPRRMWQPRQPSLRCHHKLAVPIHFCVPRTNPRPRLLVRRWKLAPFAPGQVRLCDSFRTRVAPGRTQAGKVRQVVREAHPTPIQFRLPLAENLDGSHQQLPALAQGTVVQMEKLQKFGRRWRRGDQRPVVLHDDRFREQRLRRIGYLLVSLDGITARTDI